MNPNKKTRCTTSGLLTGTGAESVYDLTVAISYAIGGLAYSKATVTDGVTPTTDAVTGLAFNPVLPDQACAFVWTLDSSGTVGLIQGEIVTVDGDTDIRDFALQFPDVPTNLCPFAYTVFQTDGTAAAAGLLIGTANWNATGLTATHTNIHELPDRPIAN